MRRSCLCYNTARSGAEKEGRGKEMKARTTFSPFWLVPRTPIAPELPPIMAPLPAPPPIIAPPPSGCAPPVGDVLDEAAPRLAPPPPLTLPRLVVMRRA